jgi:hypothetical protein
MALKQTLICLFEGITLQAPSLNYLINLYKATFQSFNSLKIKSQLKQNLTLSQRDSDQFEIICTEEIKSIPLTPSKKAGAFSSIFSKLTSKDDKKQKLNAKPVE